MLRKYRSQLTNSEVRTCVIRFVECGIDDDIMLLVVFGFDLSLKAVPISRSVPDTCDNIQAMSFSSLSERVVFGTMKLVHCYNGIAKLGVNSDPLSVY